MLSRLRESLRYGKIWPANENVEEISLDTQLVMDKLTDLESKRIGGRNVNNIRYADDRILIVHSEEKLQSLGNRLHEECREKGLRIN